MCDWSCVSASASVSPWLLTPPARQLATRSVHHQVCPSLTMHLVLAGGFDRSSVVLQTDAGTLLHLISSLEAALATLKSSATRRVLRNIKWAYGGCGLHTSLVCGKTETIVIDDAPANQCSLVGYLGETFLCFVLFYTNDSRCNWLSCREEEVEPSVDQ